MTNVTYKAVGDSDISTPGTYTLEIDTYDLTNADYYDVTLDTGTLTVYALADYESVKEAISKAEKLDMIMWTLLALMMLLRRWITIRMSMSRSKWMHGKGYRWSY